MTIVENKQLKSGKEPSVGDKIEGIYKGRGGDA